MSEAQREAVYPRIMAEAIAMSVAWVTARVIDEADEGGRYDAVSTRAGQGPW